MFLELVASFFGLLAMFKFGGNIYHDGLKWWTHFSSRYEVSVSEKDKEENMQVIEQV